MVTIKKISSSINEVVYEYYPEGKTEFPGIIVADLIERKVFLREVSQNDFYCKVMGSELNAMKDNINKMRVEDGEEPYSEEELPTCDPDKDYGGYMYAGKALIKLAQFFGTNDFREEGMVAWY